MKSNRSMKHWLLLWSNSSSRSLLVAELSLMKRSKMPPSSGLMMPSWKLIRMIVLGSASIGLKHLKIAIFCRPKSKNMTLKYWNIFRKWRLTKAGMINRISGLLNLCSVKMNFLKKLYWLNLFGLITMMKRQLELKVLKSPGKKTKMSPRNQSRNSRRTKKVGKKEPLLNRLIRNLSSISSRVLMPVKVNWTNLKMKMPKIWWKKSTTSTILLKYWRQNWFLTVWNII